MTFRVKLGYGAQPSRGSRPLCSPWRTQVGSRYIRKVTKDDILLAFHITNETAFCG
jgi:hypothetical protein